MLDFIFSFVSKKLYHAYRLFNFKKIKNNFKNFKKKDILKFIFYMLVLFFVIYFLLNYGPRIINIILTYLNKKKHKATAIPTSICEKKILKNDFKYKQLPYVKPTLREYAKHLEPFFKKSPPLHTDVPLQQRVHETIKNSMPTINYNKRIIDRFMDNHYEAAVKEAFHNDEYPNNINFYKRYDKNFHNYLLKKYRKANHKLTFEELYDYIKITHFKEVHESRISQHTRFNLKA